MFNFFLKIFLRDFGTGYARKNTGLAPSFSSKHYWYLTINARTIRSTWLKNKLELFIVNWSYSYNLKIVFATYRRMRANRTYWAGTRPYTPDHVLLKLTYLRCEQLIISNISLMYILHNYLHQLFIDPVVLSVEIIT